jgi:peptidoglycan hydrolase-like protein with peptidoglycan-binding domain
MLATSPSPASPTASAPVAAQVQLALTGTHGSPSFAFAGQSLTLHGSVRPFLAGQSVVVSVRAAGDPVRRTRLAIERSASGVGTFAMRLSSGGAGSLSVQVSHSASAGMMAFSDGPLKLKVVPVSMGEGARGQGVWFLQRRLSYLHYAVPLSGVYEAGTANAVVAYRKMMGLARVSSTGAGVISDLERGAGTFKVRFPHDGKHVEANLTKQVLAEIEPRGRVYKIYTTSSGKPSTPTVLGRYQVYLKSPGVSSDGMVDSNYFIRGYAIHGYAEVPTWAASHGCLRVPIEDALAIYGWVQVGTIVDIYY